MKNGINSFVSEEALSLHKDYLKSLKLRYSVMEKSFPEIKNAHAKQLQRMRHRYKDEILDLRCDIFCHELFFDSFGDAYQRCVAARAGYRTESSFIYEIFEASKISDASYLVISTDRGTVNIKPLGKAREILKISYPALCIDLCEHSYFLDYGFDKERYISNLLPYLNLSTLDKFLADKD